MAVRLDFFPSALALPLKKKPGGTLALTLKKNVQKIFCFLCVARVLVSQHSCDTSTYRKPCFYLDPHFCLYTHHRLSPILTHILLCPYLCLVQRAFPLGNPHLT